MTSIKSYSAHAAKTTPPPDSRLKTMLFCPSCGHESPVDGNWEIEQTDEGQTYSCPWCHTVISTRDGVGD